MAYIPDIAFDDKDEVGQKAFDLFVFYCKHGSMENNRVTVSLESAAKFFGIAYENICRLNAVLKKKEWIILDAGDTVLLKGWTIGNINFKSRKNRQKLMILSVSMSKTDDFISFEQVEPSKTDENNSFEQAVSKTDESISFQPNDVSKTDDFISSEMSKTDESISSEQSEECQKLTFSSVSPLEPPKGYINYSEPALLKPENRERESKSAGANFEPFPETEKLVDRNFRRIVDETLFWIQQDKQISRRNFPAGEWLDVIEKLALENIHCVEGDGGFKDFYQWVEGQDWVETVTPKLLMSQIEKYKKRDVIAEKRKRIGGRKDKNGNSGNNRSDSELSDEEWTKLNAHLLPTS